MRLLGILSMSLLFVVVTGCATSPNPHGGFFYTNLKGPNHALENKSGGSKSGMACATTVLAVAGWGDASIKAAQENGGITEIVAVDYEFMNVVGPVYTKTCTLVSGN